MMSVSWIRPELLRPVAIDHDVFMLSDGDQKIGAVYIGERDGDVWLELVEDARRLYLSEGFSSAGETETHHLLRKSAQN
jgi:hypothetical protein